MGDVRVEKEFEVLRELNQSFGRDLIDVLILFFHNPTGNFELLGFGQGILSPPNCRRAGILRHMRISWLGFSRRRTRSVALWSSGGHGYLVDGSGRCAARALFARCIYHTTGDGDRGGGFVVKRLVRGFRFCSE